MAVSIKAFLALEASMALRLSSTAATLFAPTYKAIQQAVEEEDWDQAHALVQTLTYDEVFTLNKPYIEYLSQVAILFGASRASNTPRTTVVGLGFEKETVDLVVQSFKAQIDVSAGEYLRDSAMQLIALSKSQVTPPVEEVVFKDSEASRKAWLTRRRNATPSASAWAGVIDPDLKLSSSTRESIEGALKDLAAAYPSLAGIDVRAGDYLEGGETLATKSKTAIILNKSLWQDDKFLAKYEKDWEGALIDGSVRGIIIHESGHILDGQLLDKLGSKKYNAFLDKYLGQLDTGKTTPYGVENTFEAMAETFTANFMGKGPAGAHKDTQASIMATAKSLWQAADEVLKK